MRGQQYTQDNYNITYKLTNNSKHKTTATVHTTQLTTIHTRKLKTKHTRQLTTIHTRHLKVQHVQKVNNTTVRKYCIQFPVFFPTHTLLTLSPQSCTSHHFTTHIDFSHKVSFLPPFLHCTSLHFTSLHFTSLHFTSLHFTSLLLDDFHFILLRFFAHLVDFQHTLTSFNSPRLSKTPPKMEPATFRLVTQCLNQLYHVR